MPNWSNKKISGTPFYILCPYSSYLYEYMYLLPGTITFCILYSTLNCKDIDSLWISSSVKFGRQKFVDRAYVDRHGQEMIIKSQTVDQQLKIKCLQSVYNADKCEVRN